ncbi:MAG: hypothetical protein ABI895_15555 [Deltaproteobacteria bacterium]
MLVRWMVVLSGALVPCFGATGCQSAKAAKAELVTRVEMVRPASERPAGGPASRVAPAEVDPADVDPVDEAAEYCRQVERQARDTNASLPKRLDRDTKATRVAAFGCDVVLEYAMLDLTVDEVALDGMREMRSDVLQKLCSDRGARGVMEHGGSFTNVYRDEQSALIDQFTITTEDCFDRRSADGTPARVDL